MKDGGCILGFLMFKKYSSTLTSWKLLFWLELLTRFVLITVMGVEILLWAYGVETIFATGVETILGYLPDPAASYGVTQSKSVLLFKCIKLLFKCIGVVTLFYNLVPNVNRFLWKANPSLLCRIFLYISMDLFSPAMTFLFLTELLII